MYPLSGKAEEFFAAHSTTIWFTKIGCCDILEMKEQAALELGQGGQGAVGCPAEGAAGQAEEVSDDGV